LSEYLTYLPGQQPLHGAAGLKQQLMMGRQVFPDLIFSISDQIAEGDKVVVMWTSRGTCQNPIMGMGIPAGTQMMFVGIDVWRLVNGKVVEFNGLNQPIGPPPPGS
jgi:predicted ester cyclase